MLKDVMEPERHHILVIDDQIGKPGSPEREDFLEAVGYPLPTGTEQDGTRYPYEFEFHTGQTDSGMNSVEAVKEVVLHCWPAADGKRWTLVLLDVRFGKDGAFGFDVLRALRADGRLGRDLPIVMLTSEDEGKKAAADSLRADGFLPKADKEGTPVWNREALEQRVQKYGLIADDRDDELIEATHTTRLLGRSLAWLKVMREARRYALDLRGSRILYGETGSGKTELAGYIHCFTARRRGPYVHWFADPASKELMKSELFGWWRNAFDGADRPQAGKIEEAHGGTFFLDEVANLPPDIQSAFLQFRKRDAVGWRILSRVGKFPQNQRDQQEARQSIVTGARLLAQHQVQVDVLLLAGTKEDLENPEVRQRLGFRDDLQNALGTPLECPPLNARREDIPQLFDAFVRRFLTRAGCPLPEYHIEPSVFEFLKERNWSQRGNVRDLERIAEYAAQNLGDFPTIRTEQLPEDVQCDADKKGFQLAAPKPAQSAKPAEFASPAAAAETVETETAAAVEAHPGALTRAELRHLRLRATLLEGAAEATRKMDAATGAKGKCQPTLAVSRLMGHKVTTTNAKRVLKEVLGMIFATPGFLERAYGEDEVKSLRDWAKSRPVLMALYRYATDKTRADEM